MRKKSHQIQKLTKYFFVLFSCVLSLKTLYGLFSPCNCIFTVNFKSASYCAAFTAECVLLLNTKMRLFNVFESLLLALNTFSTLAKLFNGDKIFWNFLNLRGEVDTFSKLAMSTTD